MTKRTQNKRQMQIQLLSKTYQRSWSDSRKCLDSVVFELMLWYAMIFHQAICNENNDERQRLCKAFFLDNLNIRWKVLYTLIEQKWLSAVRGQKGKKSVIHRISEEDINFVRKHIESFPRIQSHYNRKRSKKYLESTYRSERCMS